MQPELAKAKSFFAQQFGSHLTAAADESSQDNDSDDEDDDMSDDVSDDDAEGDEAEESSDESSEIELNPELAKAREYFKKQKEIEEEKEQIASLAAELLENPEEKVRSPLITCLHVSNVHEFVFS